MSKAEKPSEMANRLFDEGHTVEEVADRIRQRYNAYKTEDGDQ